MSLGKNIMLTAILFFLLLIVFLCAIFHNYRASTILSCIALIYLYICGSWFTTTIILKPLELSLNTTPPVVWQKNNAIIVLGAGAMHIPQLHIVQPTLLAYSRINAAAQQYFSCQQSGNACTVVISGGDALNAGRSEAEVYKDELIKLNIDPKHILVEPRSLNTYENAAFTTELLKNTHYDQYILVTSNLHLRRSVLYFSYFNLPVIPVAADYPVPMHSLFPTSYNLALTDIAIHEYLGIARLYVYNWLGFNKKRSSA